VIFLLLIPLATPLFAVTIKRETMWTSSKIKQTLKNLTAESEAAPDLKMLVLLPLPRYVTEKCCPDPEHITNFGSDSYLGKISDELEVIGDLVRDWAHNKHSAAATVVDYRMVLDDASAELDRQKIDGNALWAADDPVHGIPALYSAIGLCILANIDEMGGEVSEPLQKWPGLKAWWFAARKRPNHRRAAEPKAGHPAYCRSLDVGAATGEAVVARLAAAEAGSPTEADHAFPTDGGSSGAAGPSESKKSDKL
jgi:hypothetical protein